MRFWNILWILKLHKFLIMSVYWVWIIGYYDLKNFIINFFLTKKILDPNHLQNWLLLIQLFFNFKNPLLKSNLKLSLMNFFFEFVNTYISHLTQLKLVNIILKCQNKTYAKKIIIFMIIWHGFWLLWTCLDAWSPLSHGLQCCLSPWSYIWTCDHDHSMHPLYLYCFHFVYI